MWSGIRLIAETARIEVMPTPHRAGMPVEAVARVFGFRGAVTVEEVIIRAGDTVNADGLLQDIPLYGAGPFRVPSVLALHEATVRLPSRGLAPAADSLGVRHRGRAPRRMGLATWAAWRYHLAHLPQASAWRIGSLPISSALVQLSAPELPHPRFP